MDDRLAQNYILTLEDSAKERLDEWEDAVKRARAKVLDRIAYKYVCSQRDDPESYLMKYFGDKIEWENDYDRRMAEDIRHRNEGKQSDSWFVTFNPPAAISPADLWEMTHKYLTKNTPKALKAWHLVIEQRSEDPEQPSGWHVHFIVQYHDPVTRSVATQKMRTVVDKLWSREDQKHPQFYRAWCVWKHLGPQHKAYIEGDKREEKLKKVGVDKITRAAYGFPDFASSGQIIFPGIDIVSDGIQEVCEETTWQGKEVS